MSAVGPAAAHLHRPGDSHSDCVSFLGAQLPPEVAAMPQLLGQPSPWVGPGKPNLPLGLRGMCREVLP